MSSSVNGSNGHVDGSSSVPTTPEEWRAALESLPSTPDKIPAFFFGHGSPMLQWPADLPHRMGGATFETNGPNGPLAKFLADFGPALLEKYKPKGIVVFSAHWETRGERLGTRLAIAEMPDWQTTDGFIFAVTDYGNSQPLLMDYFGFDPALYKLKFVSDGSSELSARVVELFKEAGMPARATKVSESRGRDGRGFNGPGFDHGVFIPFRIMFGHEFHDIPIVQASIDESLNPESNWAIGRAISKLR